MYANVWSHVHVGEGYSEFEVKVGVYQGLVHSPLAFIIVLEALSCEFHSGVPGRTSVPMTLLSSLNRSRNVSGGSRLGKKQCRRKFVCVGFTAQSTQWGHVERGQFT